MRLYCGDQFIFLAGVFFLLSAAALRLCAARRRSPLFRTILLAGCFFILLLPVGGVPLYAYLRGIASGLSALTVCLSGSLCIRELSGCEVMSPRDRAYIFRAVAAAGLVLYPSAIGLLPCDLYRMGYQPLYPLLVLLAVAVASWRRAGYGAAACVIILVAAYDLRLLESDNLWDYLLDPFLAIYAWGWVTLTMARSLRRRCRQF